MTRFKPILIGALGLVLAGGVAHALEVDPKVAPEINFFGRALATANYTDKDLGAAGDDSGADADIFDSSLVFGFSKYLFNDTDYGFATFGLSIPEDDSDLNDDIFLHQLQIGIGGSNSELMLGRSRLPANTLIQFPTIRDDDLLDFTHVANASSNREAEEDTIYGGQLRGTLYWPGTSFFSFAALTARVETDVANLADTARKSSTNLNGLSVGLAYDVPEAIKFDSGVRYAGVAFDVQQVDELSGTGEDELIALLGGLSYNLTDNPERAWALDLQGIYIFGISAPGLAGPVTRARAESWSVAAALRFARRPYLQTKWQAALTVALKDYSDFDDATSFALAPSIAWRLGSGIEALAQYRFVANDGVLGAGLGLNSSHHVSFGLSFSFDATFNESVGQRNAILNLEHDMLDNGPILGGH
jgi:hypothetical protein